MLHSVNFVAEAGKTTALVGRSGGGKSTVMSLILRLYDIEAGAILCDGVDIATVKRESVRRQIGYVAQENFLFKGSVRDNIAMGRPGASEAEIVAAAKAAYAHDFIMGFERGYDTPCGEHGMQLSGGQRQRIAIARAFLKDAPIILLDEATSALNSESEQAIQKALQDPVRGPHDPRHRAPPVDGGPGRRDLRHRPRPDRRARPPPRPARAGAHLQPDRADAVPGERGLRTAQAGFDHDIPRRPGMRGDAGSTRRSRDSGRQVHSMRSVTARVTRGISKPDIDIDFFCAA